MVLVCVGAIDQGTQSTRFTLYDRNARNIAKFHVDIVQHRLQAGCALTVKNAQFCPGILTPTDTMRTAVHEQVV